MEAIYNSMVADVAIFGPGVGSSDGSGKPELMQLMEKWRDGIALIKPKERNSLPGFVEKDLATKIAMESRQGVVWLPRSAVIVPQDENVFEGTFGKVQTVTIRGATSIPEWIEFAGKTMKVEKNKENRLQRSAEALACPVDHPGVIKLLYLNTRTNKSYSMWWNGGSLMSMMAYDRTFMETHEDEILRSAGHLGCVTRRTWRFGRRFRMQTDRHTCPSVLFRRTSAIRKNFTIFFFTLGNFSEVDVSNLDPRWRRARADGCVQAQTFARALTHLRSRAPICQKNGSQWDAWVNA